MLHDERQESSMESNVHQRGSSSIVPLRPAYSEILRQKELFFSPGAAERRELREISRQRGKDEGGTLGALPPRLLQVSAPPESGDLVVQGSEHPSNSYSRMQVMVKRSGHFSTGKVVTGREDAPAHRSPVHASACSAHPCPAGALEDQLAGRERALGSSISPQKRTVERGGGGMLLLSVPPQKNASGNSRVSRVGGGERQGAERAVTYASRGTSPVRIRSISAPRLPPPPSRNLSPLPHPSLSRSLSRSLHLCPPSLPCPLPSPPPLPLLSPPPSLTPSPPPLPPLPPLLPPSFPRPLLSPSSSNTPVSKAKHYIWLLVSTQCTSPGPPRTGQESNRGEHS